MKIKTKVLLGFSIMPLVILIFIGVGWYQIHSINKATEQMQTKYLMVYTAGEIQREIKNVAIGLRNIMIYADQEDIRLEIHTLQSASESINQNIRSLEGYALTEEQKKRVGELKETNLRFMEYKDKMIDLVNQGQEQTAIALMNSESKPLQDQYFQGISHLYESFQKDMGTSFDLISKDFRQQLFWGILISLGCLILGLGFLIRGIWNATTRLNQVSSVMLGVSNGTLDLNTRLVADSSDEIDDVSRSFNTMTKSLEEQVAKEQKLSKENQEFAWVKTHLAEIMAHLSGIQELQAFTQTFLSKIAPLVDASQAIFYIKEWDKEKNEPVFQLLSSYAYKERHDISHRFRLGEGIVGQAALEKKPIFLTHVPQEHIRISTGLGESSPLNLYVLPIHFEGEVIAVIEMASFQRLSATQQALLEELIGHLGMMMDSILGRIRLAASLQESQILTEELQAQSEELQAQQEELRATNEELEAQAQALKQSEARLQVQQEELEETNEELRQKTEIYEVQNKNLEKARWELEEKAKQLALSSKYKSEFLANMSHELRTPLNSLLILSRLLAENKDQNLTDKQVEFAQTIYSSGSDLLTLINDILDLAKIESGKMDVHPSQVLIKDLAEFAEKSFSPMANEKKLEFTIDVKNEVQHEVYSDGLRLQQVLMNLLSNAFKFTHQGKVKLEIGIPSHPYDQYGVYFSISDTGIGIPEEKQAIVFEAFQQADGTTNRKYGGTGLGLSICRELASLLGGEIVVVSAEGKGSTFTFYVSDYPNAERPKTREVKMDERKEPVKITPSQPPRSESAPTIKRLLIVDDDKRQRNSLMELIGEKNVIIKAVSTGAEALEELKVQSFDSMVLDLGLADTTGFELLEKIKSTPSSDRLKIFIYTGRDLTTKEEILLKKHAHAIIIKDAQSLQRLSDELDWFLHAEWGSHQEEVAATEAMIHLSDLAGKTVLLVDDDVRNVFAISNILELYGMKVTFVENGVECLQTLDETPDGFDLVLMDIMMPEKDGYETIKEIRKKRELQHLPIIALTAKAMIEDREKCMDAGASDYIVKPVNPDQLISLIRVWVFPDAEDTWNRE